MRASEETIGVAQWIGWIIATATAAFTLVVFIYSNFTTKSEATLYQDDLSKRLDRIESKIDKLMMKK